MRASDQKWWDTGSPNWVAYGSPEPTGISLTEGGFGVWYASGWTVPSSDDEYQIIVIDDSGNRYQLAVIVVDDTNRSAPTVVQIRQEMDSNSTQLAAIVADTNELQTDNIPGTLSTIAGYIDTEVASILTAVSTTIPTLIGTPTDTDIATDIANAQTVLDSFTFTVAGQVDANIQYVNDTAVTGDGGSGTEWGP